MMTFAIRQISRYATKIGSPQECHITKVDRESLLIAAGSRVHGFGRVWSLIAARRCAARTRADTHGNHSPSGKSREDSSPVRHPIDLHSECPNYPAVPVSPGWYE